MSIATPHLSPARWSSVVDTTAPTATPRRSDKLEQDVADLAAIVDLLERIAAAPDLATACHTAAGELQQYLKCDRVALGLTARNGRRCRLKAVSGVAEFDPASPLARAIEGALDEALLAGAARTWPVSPSDEGQGSSAHHRLAETSGAAAVFTVPLARLGNAPIGACTLFWSGEQVSRERQQRFVKAFTGPLAAVLEIASRGHERPWLRTLKQVLTEKVLRRRKLLLPLVAIAAAAMFLPVPYRVGCECQIQPVTRRVVAAPFAGTLEKSLVKPGDIVRRGDVLGRMDGREIRWELAGLIADQSRAAKSRDVNMAASKVAAAQIDALEMQRLEVKRRLLADRADHLDVKSPVDGVVISGDLKRAEGAPVAIGQSLYEIAPLNRMLAEVAIPDAEISYARPGQSVAISLDAFPGANWSATVATIQPRSELHDNDNVFIAEVNLDNRQLTLRPGMKGQAKIETDSHSLGWIVFHKPWSRVCGWLGW